MNEHEHAAEDETISEPVMDGATDHDDHGKALGEEGVDPREGMSDPALIRDVEDEKKTVNPYG